MTREKITSYKIALFLLFTTISFAQTTIRGQIFDNEKSPVSDVTVVLYGTDDKILSYSISDVEGNYNLKFTTTLKEIKLQIKAFNYESVIETVANESQTINYTLIPTVTKLREVIVKESSIRKKGDTLSYNVASFASDKDITIADIIAKMPGIDVLPDGKILYQGKPINKYYIEGLDLLEGKYNLANKNLPYSQVSKVQILENHQPIRVLDSLVFSESAALNIKLKNNVSVTFGRGEDNKAQQLLDLAASNGFEPQQKSDVAWNTLTALFQERVESGLDMPSEVFSTWIKDTTKITRK